jgi:hypothetical protein
MEKGGMTTVVIPNEAGNLYARREEFLVGKRHLLEMTSTRSATR